MKRVAVSTPSRLHFGLLRLHETSELSFGGLGMMIDQPRVQLELAAADAWHVTGSGSRRASTLAQLALAAVDALNKPAALSVLLTSVVPQHRGLGSGTQLALALAAGVRELLGLPAATAQQLALVAGRGARSAVGSHGFLHGGLIWERGRARDATLSALTAQTPLPVAWGAVLIFPPRGRGLSGSAERHAFQKAPRVPTEVTRQLETIAEHEILPAARSGNFDAFGESVYRYGRCAGECFAPIQGGAYASAEIASLVAALREAGVRGVGQSSWGPTVYALTPTAAARDDLMGWLRGHREAGTYDLIVAAVDNRGAVIETASY